MRGAARAAPAMAEIPRSRAGRTTGPDPPSAGALNKSMANVKMAADSANSISSSGLPA